MAIAGIFACINNYYMLKRFFIVVCIMISAGALLQSFAGESLKVEGNSVAIENFSSLSLEVPFDVYFTQDAQVSAKVEGVDDIDATLEFVQKGNDLKIKLKKSAAAPKHVKIFLSAPKLESVSMSKNGNFYSTNKLTTDKSFHAAIAGSGTMDIELQSKSLAVDIAGSGNAEFKGETGKLDLSIAGSGDYNGENMVAADVKVAIAGTGDAHVFAKSSVDASVAGSGDVIYSGDPAQVSSDIAGSGKVKKSNS